MRTDRKLFGSYEIMKDFIDHNLEKTQILDGGWSAKYIDKKTGIEWLEYLADDRSSIKHLIQINPPLNTTDLITIALNSNYPDEVQAASVRLYIEEMELDKPYREKLIEEVEKKLRTSPYFEKEKIIIAIKYSGILSKINRKNIIGKHYTEVFEDADYFIKTANRASEILQELER